MKNYPLYSQENTALEKKVVSVKLFGYGFEQRGI